MDELRAAVLKNLAMTVPMFLLVAAIAFGDDLFTPWQERFTRATSLWQRIVQGRALLFVTVYYIVWAFVELKWPSGSANSGFRPMRKVPRAVLRATLGATKDEVLGVVLRRQSRSGGGVAARVTA